VFAYFLEGGESIIEKQRCADHNKAPQDSRMTD
jgi:hypothetical protein